MVAIRSTRSPFGFPPSAVGRSFYWWLSAWRLQVGAAAAGNHDGGGPPSRGLLRPGAAAPCEPTPLAGPLSRHCTTATVHRPHGSRGRALLRSAVRCPLDGVVSTHPGRSLQKPVVSCSRSVPTLVAPESACVSMEFASGPAARGTRPRYEHGSAARPQPSSDRFGGFEVEASWEDTQVAEEGRSSSFSSA